MPTVFLAISSSGLTEAIQLASTAGSAVWCGSDAISEGDFQAMANRSVTRFIYPLQGKSVEVLNDALSTIEEHHPGARIWVEQPRPQA